MPQDVHALLTQYVQEVQLRLLLLTAQIILQSLLQVGGGLPLPYFLACMKGVLQVSMAGKVQNGRFVSNP